jgi:hypothetical protein
MIVFLSARRKNAKVVLARFQALHPSMMADPVIETASVMWMMDYATCTVVLCRGYGAIPHIGDRLRHMRAMGTTIVDEWNREITEYDPQMQIVPEAWQAQAIDNMITGHREGREIVIETPRSRRPTAADQIEAFHVPWVSLHWPSQQVADWGGPASGAIGSIGNDANVDDHPSVHP